MRAGQRVLAMTDAARNTSSAWLSYLSLNGMICNWPRSRAGTRRHRSCWVHCDVINHMENYHGIRCFLDFIQHFMHHMPHALQTLLSILVYILIHCMNILIVTLCTYTWRLRVYDYGSISPEKILVHVRRAHVHRVRSLCSCSLCVLQISCGPTLMEDGHVPWLRMRAGCSAAAPKVSHLNIAMLRWPQFNNPHMSPPAQSIIL